MLDDLETESFDLFNPKEWIRHNRKYRDVPRHVSDTLVSLQKIPRSEKSSLFPPSDTPIKEFIEFELPTLSAEIIATKTSAWFSTESPQPNAFQLLNIWSVPPSAFLAKLESAMGQAWFDGNISITDPRYNAGRDRLPFWALTFWQQMAKRIGAQIEWKRAKKWVMVERKASEDPFMFPPAEYLFRNHGWNTLYNHYPSMTNRVLAQLLGNNTLSDDIMLSMIKNLQGRLEENIVMR